MLEIKDLSLSVQGDRDDISILKNINLVLNDGSLYVITGPNGGGKSTLAKLIMGIYKPSSGSIIYNGQDITNLDISERAQMGIGYAFQQPPRFKGITVRQLLELAVSRSGKDINLYDLLLDVGLCAQDYLDREVDGSLSGGELKRIEIASVLARDSRLAVFDEPEAGIDLWSFQRLADTFKKIHSKYYTTLVIISHQERILNLADEVIMVADGMVHTVTSKEKFMSELVNSRDCRCGQDCGKGVNIIAGYN